jgi:subtilisin family serine protease
MPKAAVDALRRHPLVDYIEQDATVTLNSTQTNATWGIDRIDQRDRPLNGTYTYGLTGSGVRAYIIDTGILGSHQDFGGRVQETGFTAINDGQGSTDCNGHGTHVAGTVGGTVYGVAKNVELVAVRVLSCSGSGSTSGVIAGVDWVAGQSYRPAVANMSLGGGASSTLDTAVRKAHNAGVTMVVAAGNSNANACNYSPAREPTAITVGATTSSDARASYSNFGSCLDLFAPGSSITAAWHTSNTATNTISGTSMASPHVAGVAALLLQSSPSASPTQVASAIASSASTGKVSSAGSRSPNLLLFSDPNAGGNGEEPAPNTAPTASFTFSCADLSCNFNGSGSSDPDGSISSYAWNFGDGTAGSGATISHTYGTADTYTVTLTVTDNGGATDTSSQSVTVTAPQPPAGSGPTLSGFSSKSGSSWVANITLTGTPGQKTSGLWSGTSGTSSCTIQDGRTSCSFRSNAIANRVGSVTYTDSATGEVIRVFKP